MMTFLLTISTDFFWAFWLSAVSDPLFTSFHKSSSLQPVNKVVKCHLTSTRVELIKIRGKKRLVTRQSDTLLPSSVAL